MLVPIGPAFGLAGSFWLASMPALVGGIMLVGAGGILYLMFQDIAPQATLANRHAPALGAVAGFACGVIADALVG